jgi:hypothetical protein
LSVRFTTEPPSALAAAPGTNRRDRPIRLLAVLSVPLLTIASLPPLKRLEDGLDAVAVPEVMELAPPSGR